MACSVQCHYKQVDQTVTHRKILMLTKWLIVFCATCASCDWKCQCAIFAQDSHLLHNICARLYLFPQCAIYVQDCTYFPNAQYMRKIVLNFPMRMRKIVLISPMHNICARFAQIVLLSPVCNTCARPAQDCTYFSNAQYMSKICAKLYLTSNLKC